MKLGGVIYLNDISQNRNMMLGLDRKNFDIFRELCGEKAQTAIVLGTTKWANVKPEVGEQREEELTAVYGKELKVHRFQNSQESAWEMVNIILARFRKVEPPSAAGSSGVL